MGQAGSLTIIWRLTIMEGDDMALERTILTVGVILLTLSVAAMAPAAQATQVTQAQGASHCAPRERVIDRLASTYGETRRAMGLGANNAVIEVFASTDSGSWTITITLPSGMTCLVASGQAYEALGGVLAAPGKDV
ncbi:MAG: hypothetical protein ACNA7O_18840 [Rhodobacterales bacterium]